MNKYAIITVSQLDEFYPYYVGEKETQRLSLDGTKAVIKFPSDNINPIFGDLIIYNLGETLEIMSTLEWTSNEI